MDEQGVSGAETGGNVRDDGSRELSATEELLRASIHNLNEEMLEEEEEEEEPSDDSSSDLSPRSDTQSNR